MIFIFKIYMVLYYSLMALNNAKFLVPSIPSIFLIEGFLLLSVPHFFLKLVFS